MDDIFSPFVQERLESSHPDVSLSITRQFVDLLALMDGHIDSAASVEAMAMKICDDAGRSRSSAASLAELCCISPLLVSCSHGMVPDPHDQHAVMYMRVCELIRYHISRTAV